MKLLFWNTCSNRRALGQWFLSFTRAQNSSCVAQRATTCRSFISTPNAGNRFNQWSPFPSGYTQLVVTNVTGCAAITIDRMYNVYYYNYASVLGQFSNYTRSPVNRELIFFKTKIFLCVFFQLEIVNILPLYHKAICKALFIIKHLQQIYLHALPLLANLVLEFLYYIKLYFENFLDITHTDL